MAITTKKGDAGISHWHGRAVGKDDVLIEAIGSLDELQAAIGVSGLDLPEVMKDMWGIMGEVSAGMKYEKLEERIELMENEINRMEEELPQLSSFLIFTKAKSSQLNWVRTMVRRAERRLVALSKKEDVSPKLLAYINRLSDYLFMLARVAENE
ncbi:MAG: cob(I)yrinic acid a,c-diamide adenosyltransferase [Candidatus Shapirobacteria bacterium]|jgi:cob(I)alamin adenosyltransferase